MQNTNITLCSPRLSANPDANQLNPVLSISRVPDVIPANHVLIKVDRFGFSANNVTYQALGEHPHFRYFDFHPAPTVGDVSLKTHGLIPVWGFGTIVKSTHPKIMTGERVYGYLAPTRYLLLRVSPSDVNKHSFYVPRPHLPADRRPYNQIIRCASDPQYDPQATAEDMTMLYRPLFWTSYWCEDWLFSSQYRGGANTIIISSASSKTALCLAYLVRKRIARGEVVANTKVIGITSRRNIQFTADLQLYHEILTYDAFESSPSLKGPYNRRRIYVDVAGNESFNKRLIAHLKSQSSDSLAGMISLGLTNLSPSSSSSSTMEWRANKFSSTAHANNNEKNSASEFQFEQFFMPEWLNVRRKQVPILEITQRQNAAWKDLMEEGINWVRLQRVYGGENVKREYELLAKHGLGPEKGMIWSLWDKDEESIRDRLVPSKL